MIWVSIESGELFCKGFEKVIMGNYVIKRSWSLMIDGFKYGIKILNFILWIIEKRVFEMICLG